MCKTLIIEDNTAFRKSLREILLNAFPSMIIEEADRGKEVLKKIQDLSPDLIFMDIKLPGASGLELTKKIKNTHPGIAIIILTGCDVQEYRNAAYALGADGFLVKNLTSIKEIAATVTSVLPDLNQ